MSNDDFVNSELQRLTAKITNDKHLRIILSRTIQSENKCRTCYGSDSLIHVHLVGERSKAYMCKPCVVLTKRNKIDSPIKSKKDICPICYCEGNIFIEGVTNSLCNRCLIAVHSC